MKYGRRKTGSEEKARACRNNGRGLAKLTGEGLLCGIRGKHCPNQRKMSDKFTNYYLCIPEQPKIKKQAYHLNGNTINNSINYNH